MAVRGKVEGAFLWGLEEVASVLGISPAHVRRLADAGKLPRPIKLGRAVRWRVRDIEGFVESGRPATSTRRAKR